jgi:hypothetical protein
MDLRWLDSFSWTIVILACATLGLAPFNPPHIVEKLGMLSRGELHRAIDWFDLAMHGAPWVLLVLKIVAAVTQRGGGSTPS